jgi:SpoVK/Ycf46/Vps4 family AAA+-type ATPase
VRVLFAGGTRETHQQALATLAQYTVENVHQFALPALVKERRMQTQSSIRKAFDAAAEEGALLFFDRVDMLFDWHHPDSMGGEEEPTSIEYFLQRVEAYGGVVVLALEAPEHIEAARSYGLDLIVDFS